MSPQKIRAHGYLDGYIDGYLAGYLDGYLNGYLHGYREKSQLEEKENSG